MIQDEAFMKILGQPEMGSLETLSLMSIWFGRWGECRTIRRGKDISGGAEEFVRRDF